MPDKEIAERLDAIRELLKVFRFERIVYLTVTIISLILLIASAVVLVVKGKAGPVEITGLFGSAGSITYTAGRLLRMWGEALRVM